MVGWHHQLNGHEFEEVPGVGDGQVPVPAGKVDQVPRTCTVGLRKKLKQETTKMGSRGSDTSPRRDAV